MHRGQPEDTLLAGRKGPQKDTAEGPDSIRPLKARTLEGSNMDLLQGTLMPGTGPQQREHILQKQNVLFGVFSKIKENSTKAFNCIFTWIWWINWKATSATNDAKRYNND